MKSSLSKTFLYAVVTVASLFCSLQSSATSEDLEDFFSDDNLLIVELRLGTSILAEDVFLYSNSELTLVPLQALFDALEFAILVDQDRKSAEGWFLNTTNRFELDVVNRSLVLGSNIQEIPADLRIASDGFDLYVDIKSFVTWFPVELDLRIGQLRMIVEPTQELPIQRRIAREKARKHLGLNDTDDLPLIRDSYSWLGYPAIDFTLSPSIRDRDQSPNRRTADLSYFLQGNIDILKLQTNFSLLRSNLGDQATGRLRFRKKRSLPDEPIVGGLSALEFGDIFAVSDPLIFNAGSGLGIDLLYGSDTERSDFGKRDLEGEATPGWEVEVYRNNILVDFQLVPQDGRYFFQDLPLDYGENVFEIRLFGPQGQEETRREAITVGVQSLPAGESFAHLHFTNINQSIFKDAPSFSGQENSNASEQIGFFTFAHGINNTLSLKIKAAEQGNPVASQANRNYLGFGFDASLPGYALGVERISELGKGTATSLGLQTRISGSSITLNSKHYDNFASDRSNDGTLKQDTELRISSIFEFLSETPITHQLIADLIENNEDQSSLSFENRFGFNLFRGRFSWDHTYNNNPVANFQQGNLRYLRTTAVNLNLRGGLSYEIDQGFKLSAFNLNANWHPSPDWNIQFGSNIDLIGNDNNSISLGSSWDFKQVRLSTNGSLTEGGGGFLSMTVEFSLQKQQQGWAFYSDRISDFGQLHTQLFLDKNSNGIFDTGDEPIPEAAFEGVNKWKLLQSDSNGELTLTHLRSSRPSRVTLDQGSLIDPYWQANFSEARAVSHPGGVNHLLIAVRETAEVEGSLVITSRSTGEQREVAGVPVRLLNSDGKVVLTSVTEFDGYFIMSSVLPGTYFLEIEPLALERLQADPVSQTKIQVVEGVLFLDRIQLTKP